jgi:hypothetical protein
MYHIQDNFLEDTDLSFLRKSADKHYKGKFGKIFESHSEAVPYRSLDGDLTTPLIGMGLGIIPVIEKIKNVLSNYTEKLNPIENVFFQYCSPGYIIPLHQDNLRAPIKHTTEVSFLTENYKAFIYCNEKWEEDWGGQLCFHGVEILPIPNRLVIYSTDEEHWVKEIKAEATVLRTFFGVRFGYETR